MIYTYKVCGDLSIAKPSSRLMRNEIPTIRREIALNNSLLHVVVPRVDDRVAKCEQSWSQLLAHSFCASALGSGFHNAMLDDT
jgi:hypothetical protein